VTRYVAPKLGAYTGLAALGLIAALALGLPELVALAAPFALVAALGLAAGRPPDVEVELELDRDRVLQHEQVEVRLEVRTSGEAPCRFELFVRLPRGLSVVSGENPASIRIGPGEAQRVEFLVRVDRWGAHLVGDVYVRTFGPFNIIRYEQRLDCRRPLRTYPAAEAVRELLRPIRTQVFAGNQVAREKGEGIEFADLRPFVPGDRIRRVNWRASARRRELWVNELHPERNTDVVLFLDSFAEAARGGTGTLDLAVSAAIGLAERYLKAKDRVGLVSFGGVLNWLVPGTGPVQMYRIVDSVLDTEVVLNYAWKDIEVIPRRTLPPQAMVVALTPLLDERATDALLDVRARGFDLAVVEISPLRFTEQGRGKTGELAWRLWTLKREAVRARFERAGVPVARWDERVPLAAALEEVRSFRRYGRMSRV
jgi:uncharacterized protein (DUF58 family)